MAGRYPKPDDERRNKTPSPFNWTLLPASGRKGAAPKLPARRPDNLAWSASTRAWWSKLWHTPQATQWSDHDDALHRMAWLREKFWSNMATGTEMAELRQIEDRFGLNDKALLQLRWRIVPDDELVEAEPPSGTAAGGARRERLRVVS